MPAMHCGLGPDASPSLGAEGGGLPCALREGRCGAGDAQEGWGTPGRDLCALPFVRLAVSRTGPSRSEATSDPWHFTGIACEGRGGRQRHQETRAAQERSGEVPCAAVTWAASPSWERWQLFQLQGRDECCCHVQGERKALPQSFLQVPRGEHPQDVPGRPLEARTGWRQGLW